MCDELEALANRWKAVWGGRHEHECAEELRAVLARWDDSAQRREAFLLGAAYARALGEWEGDASDEKIDAEALRRWPDAAIKGGTP
jgi:hypothetical protein